MSQDNLPIGLENALNAYDRQIMLASKLYLEQGAAAEAHVKGMENDARHELMAAIQDSQSIAAQVVRWRAVDDFVRWYNSKVTNPTITFEQITEYEAQFNGQDTKESDGLFNIDKLMEEI